MDAARALKVDPDVATKLCTNLIEDETNEYCVIRGQLIGKTYLDQVTEDLIEKLESCGLINSLKISQQFDLPVDTIDMVLITFPLTKEGY